tara:strand:- start:77 stop:1174 length:1098 start_codon:yes stop_codon:yes gene_type:complete
MRTQKGGMCRCLGSGRWEGSNDSGEADAAFFNYLGLDCNNYWALWEYPLMDEGFMASENWKEDNKREILRLLEEIISVRTAGIENATATGRRSGETNSHSTGDAHSRILTYATQLRNLVRHNVNFNRSDDFSTSLNTEEGDDYNNYSIQRTEGYRGVVSEVGNLNPSTEQDKHESTHKYSGQGRQEQHKESSSSSSSSSSRQSNEAGKKSNSRYGGGKKSMKKKTMKKTMKKTRKKKPRKKSRKKTKKTGKKKFHVLPDNNKTIWSNDYFGERQVIDLPSYKIKTHVDNLNPITGKFKDKISDEYKRRLIIQLKKHKPSRKRFHNKTKKKYNSKSIDKILSKMTNKKVEMVYKDLLSNEKSTKRN